QTPIPLTAKLPVLPCYGGESIVRRLFEPLGYAIDLQQHPLDENFTDWGDSPYFTVKLQQTVTLQTLLSHLYVLIPVLDADKHYWIGDDEVEKLLRELIKEKTFTEIVGVDVSYRCLERAKDKLHWDRLPPMQQKRLQLLQGSLMYRDRRLEGYDAATLIEVIEHLDPPRLAAMQRVLFEFTRPQTIIITTPNREYNVKFESLSAGQFRHKDHRFEWTRQEFQDWANEVGKEYAYTVQFYSIGTVDPILGSPTQMGLFVI
ncbi:MAG: 3' terminal RNA ribose 2'-O-methyltransferase Hen1, partial [Prochloraceae cyanobacterium]|nr:3' terminal RNA ribose 2'-O-methyltransferase Hen1 [Prochloraceae cyanobacterium]